MSTFTHPAQLQTAYLSGSHHTSGSPQPATPNSTMMVHTPYSCEHDLVPTGSEVASQCFGSSLPKDEDLQANASFGQQQSSSSMHATGSSRNLHHFSSRRSTASSSSPQPEHFYQHRSQPQQPAMMQQPSFDPWTGQYLPEAGMAIVHDHSQLNTARSHDSHSSGQSSRVSSVRPQQAQAHHQPQSHLNSSQNSSNFPAFVMRAPIVNAPVHAAYLGGKAEYLEMPTQGAEITTAAQWNRAHKVFIGHVKFEINADGLRWLVYMLTGVQAGKVEVRGMGCFMVFFASAEDVFRVRGLHKRVLFDTQGIWFAQNLSQEDTLHHYATHVAPSVHAKLPKGLMVVDEETSRRRTRKHKSTGEGKLQAAFTGAPSSDTTFAVTAGVSDQQQQQQNGGGFQSHTTAAPQLDAQQMWSEQQQFSPHQQVTVAAAHQGFSRGNSAEDEYCS